MVRISNGVTLGVNNMHMVEGAEVEFTTWEMGLESGESQAVA